MYNGHENIYKCNLKPLPPAYRLPNLILFFNDDVTDFLKVKTDITGYIKEISVSI